MGLAEAEALSRAASPFPERRYGVVRVTHEWEMARSSFYHPSTLAVRPDRVLRRRGLRRRSCASRNATAAWNGSFAR